MNPNRAFYERPSNVCMEPGALPIAPTALSGVGIGWQPATNSATWPDPSR